MLTEEQNRTFTQVGPGTPMGELLRRHWMPIAGVAEFDKESIKPVKLMGEELVLYKDLSGNFGLIDRKCAHRRADMSYGFVEQSGIRCSYHGWQFNASGSCTSRPFEDVMNPKLANKANVKVKAYPVQVKAHMIWAYLGPLPAPELPDWEPFSWKNGFVQIVISDIPCNWFQCQENSIDPVHFEWMHNNWTTRLSGQLGPYAPEHKELGFESFDYGLIYKRVRGDATRDNKYWTVGRVCLWPNAFFLGDHFEWRIPVDDETSLSITWSFTRVPTESEPYEQAQAPTWKSPIVDEKTGRWITSHVINQDIVAWVGQGKIADRTKETLGLSDQGIVMLRRRLLADLDAIAQGKDPSGLIRDPALNKQVQLPILEREFLMEGMPREEMFAHPVWKQHIFEYRFAYGQPEAVQSEFRKAVGLE